MGVKLFVESSASRTEMDLMARDGCGWFLSCGRFDGRVLLQFVGLRGRRAVDDNLPRRCGANHDRGRAAFSAKKCS